MNMNKYYKEVSSYFNNKAYEYDDVDNQLYWRLSDDFFKGILKKELPSLLTNKKEVRLLDAGAGTGRWTFFVNEILQDSYNVSGTIIDISEKMLEVAVGKFKKNGLDNKFTSILGNIEEMPEVENNYYDLSISFYNVISFVENPDKSLEEISKKLKKGGIHISILANKYHSYYFSVLTNRLSSIKEIKSESKIRFNDMMPAIHCFTPEEARNLYIKAGFKDVKVVGGPNFIYPGMEETHVHGSTEEIQNKLSDQKFYDEILALELDNYNNPDISGRANAIMVIAKK